MADKVVVPDEMKKAAGRASNGFDPDGYFLYHPLEGALNWLDEKIKGLKRGDMYLDRRLYNNAIEDVRRMYLAPDSEVGTAAKNVIQSMMGCTFTPTEANEIVKHLGYHSHGWIPSCPPKEESTEPEVPEAIKGLIEFAIGKKTIPPPYYADAVIEAFRRGQKSVIK